jgi:hypothetical protein
MTRERAFANPAAMQLGSSYCLKWTDSLMRALLESNVNTSTTAYLTLARSRKRIKRCSYTNATSNQSEIPARRSTTMKAL